MQLLKGLTLFATVVAILPSEAHLLEFPGKVALPPETYFAVQSIYWGWAWFGFAVLFAVLLNAWLGLRLVRSDRVAGISALLSALLLLATIAIFFAKIFPANRLTQNWTIAAAGWERLRSSWEHGHALSGILLLLALVLTIAAALLPRRTPGHSSETS
jgi:hypothetical protein